MKFKVLTTEEKLIKQMKQLRHEKLVLTTQLDSAEKKCHHYREILESSSFNRSIAFQLRCEKQGLRAYHFAFNPDEFDLFCERIGGKPNKFFENIIKGDACV